MKTTGAYKDISTLYCPTCRKPRDEVVKAAEDDIVVLRCLNCDTALAAGKFIGFRAVCPNCGQLVVVS
jgi:Zn finger protein HypA/HybF involved in hydrogenase expression